MNNLLKYWLLGFNQLHMDTVKHIDVEINVSVICTGHLQEKYFMSRKKVLFL